MEIAALARTVRLRNLGSWTNDYYDDIAWFGLAVQRAGPLARRSTQPALTAITARLRTGWTPAGGGGIWWRRRDDFKNAPANGPAAILAARTGDLDSPQDHRLDDRHPRRPAHRAGPRRGPAQPRRDIRTVEATTYTYCQGVYLGACVELAERDGHPRWAERAATSSTRSPPPWSGRTGSSRVRRRRRRRAVQRHPGPLPGRHRGPAAASSPRSPPRSCWPARKRPGRAAPTWITPTAAGVRPALEPARPRTRPRHPRSRSLGPTVRLDAPRSRRQSSRCPHRRHHPFCVRAILLTDPVFTLSKTIAKDPPAGGPLEECGAPIPSIDAGQGGGTPAVGVPCGCHGLWPAPSPLDDRFQGISGRRPVAIA